MKKYIEQYIEYIDKQIVIIGNIIIKIKGKILKQPVQNLEQISEQNKIRTLENSVISLILKFKNGQNDTSCSNVPDQNYIRFLKFIYQFEKYPSTQIIQNGLNITVRQRKDYAIKAYEENKITMNKGRYQLLEVNHGGQK